VSRLVADQADYVRMVRDNMRKPLRPVLPEKPRFMPFTGGFAAGDALVVDNGVEQERLVNQHQRAADVTATPRLARAAAGRAGRSGRRHHRQCRRQRSRSGPGPLALSERRLGTVGDPADDLAEMLRGIAGTEVRLGLVRPANLVATMLEVLRPLPARGPVVGQRAGGRLPRRVCGR
jgi:hypothetical protein